MASINTDYIGRETVQRLRDIKKQFSDDPEAAHGMADDALLQMLLQLGFEDVVEAWEDIPKWYA